MTILYVHRACDHDVSDVKRKLKSKIFKAALAPRENRLDVGILPPFLSFKKY